MHSALQARVVRVVELSAVVGGGVSQLPPSATPLARAQRPPHLPMASSM